MITNFKIFENSENTPQIGDYVYIIADYAGEKFKEFFKHNFGKIVKIENYMDIKSIDKSYIVHFTDAQHIENDGNYDFSNEGTWEAYRREIIAFGKTKEELNLNMSANKYNL